MKRSVRIVWISGALLVLALLAVGFLFRDDGRPRWSALAGTSPQVFVIRDRPFYVGVTNPDALTYHYFFRENGTRVLRELELELLASGYAPDDRPANSPIWRSPNGLVQAYRGELHLDSDGIESIVPTPASGPGSDVLTVIYQPFDRPNPYARLLELIGL